MKSKLLKRSTSSHTRPIDTLLATIEDYIEALSPDEAVDVCRELSRAISSISRGKEQEKKNYRDTELRGV